MPDTEWLAELSLAEDEREILSTLVRDESTIETVATGLEADALWSALTTCARIYVTTKSAQSKLKPVVGRLLLELEKFPDLYKSRGYKNFDDFISNGVPEIFGLPRSESYRSKRLAATWPNLSVAEFSEIGEGKLYTLSQFTSHTDPKADEWLEIARTSTHDELRDKIVQVGNASSTAELIPVQYTFYTTLEKKRHIHEFVHNSRVQSHVGTADIGSIIVAAFLEAASSWGI